MTATQLICVPGQSFYFEVDLTDQADTKLYKANPTLASGDVVVFRDGVLLGNITTLPSVIDASYSTLACVLSAAETTGAQRLVVLFHDVAGSQWCDLSVHIRCSSQNPDDLATPAQVNAQVVDALATDTYAEPGQGTPSATTSLAAKIGYLFKAWRNKSTQNTSQYSLYNDDAATVDHKATVSDLGGTTTIGEVTSGP
jgi:hypothetical protein